MVEGGRNRRVADPLEADGLERIALAYVGRYAVTRAKLRSYLERKLQQRGWQGDRPPALDALIEKFARLGYVDDRAFAVQRAEALGRRGYGVRRVGAALKAAGVAEEDAADAFEGVAADAWPAALRFARRRRIGPFADSVPERAEREKAFAAMLRAGHPMDIARKLVNAQPGEKVDEFNDIAG